jgi:hypothetical protein
VRGKGAFKLETFPVALTPHAVVLVCPHACHEAACLWSTLGGPRPPPAPVRVTIPQGPVVPLRRHGLDVYPLEQEPGDSDSHGSDHKKRALAARGFHDQAGHAGPQHRGCLHGHCHP